MIIDWDLCRTWRGKGKELQHMTKQATTNVEGDSAYYIHHCQDLRPKTNAPAMLVIPVPKSQGSLSASSSTYWN